MSGQSRERDASQTMLDAASATTQRIPKYKRLTNEQLALLIQLRTQDKTQTEIAQVLGCHQSAVSRALSDLVDSRDLAKLRAHNRALELTEAALDGSVKAAKDGKPEAALEVLDRLDVAPKRRDEQHSAQVLVVVQQGNSIPGIASPRVLNASETS